MNKLEGEQDKYLPTVIHAIWAGGGMTLFDDGMNNLAKWAYVNPNFKIILWVDDKVVPPEMSLADMQELYVKQFMEAYIKLADQEESASEIRTRIDVKSIREDKICAQEQDSVDYAIDRLDPNYGLSSDLLRYRILHKYGGFYIDVTDVIPGDSKKLNILSAIPYANFGKINEQHKLYVDHLSQTQNPSTTDLKIFDLRTRNFAVHSEEENEIFFAQSRVGNDSFLCTKGNPLMQLMVEETERRLLCRTPSEKIMMAYGGFNKKDMTLDLSGPNMVKMIIYDTSTGTLTQNTKLTIPGYYKKIPDGSASYVLPLKSSELQVVKPPDHIRNTRYWNNVPLDISRVKSIDDVISKIVSVAFHEVTHMGVLRLDDHMKVFTQAAVLLQVPSEEMTEHYDKLLLSMRRLPLQEVSVAQCISNSPLIMKFYRENDLMSKIVLSTNDRDLLSSLLKIWEQCTSFGLFMGTGDYQPEKLMSIQTEEIEGTLQRLEIQDVFERMERGVKFISHINQNIESYPCYKDLLLLEQFKGFQKQYLQDIIIKYGIVLDAYSEAFLNTDVSPKDLNQFGRQLVELAKIDMLPKKLQQLVIMYKADDINHALRIAASKGNLNDVKYIAKYADINRQGGISKKTALHQAAEKGHKDVMECLMKYGADVNIKDKNEKTAHELFVQSSLESKK